MYRAVMISLILCVFSYKSNAADLTGRYTFQTNVRPEKTRCVKISHSLSNTLNLSDYNCNDVDTTSGSKAILCSRSGGGGYLIFKTSSACEEERKDEGVAE